jgi:hypothetical protein
MFPTLERRLYTRVLAFKDASPLPFLTLNPSIILAYISYLEGESNATEQIATGDAPTIHLNDFVYCHSRLISYIRIEQARLRASMGGDRSPDTDKFNVLKIRERAGFTGPVTPIEESTIDGLDEFEKASEDPEPFDEFTGPTGGAQ